jgi:hypothetical protein
MMRGGALFSIFPLEKPSGEFVGHVTPVRQNLEILNHGNRKS